VALEASQAPPSSGRCFFLAAFFIATLQGEERSRWQNAYAERLIGSIRRECLDHLVVFGERHLRHVLLSYMDYYNGTRTHLSLNKDAPISRAAEAAGRIVDHRPGGAVGDGWGSTTARRGSGLGRLPMPIYSKSVTEPANSNALKVAEFSMCGSRRSLARTANVAGPDLSVTGAFNVKSQALAFPDVVWIDAC
jgi:hypothetical protein